MASFHILWTVIALLHTTHAYDGLPRCNCMSDFTKRGDEVTVPCHNIHALKSIKVMECKNSPSECNESMVRMEVNDSHTSSESEFGSLSFNPAKKTAELILYGRNAGCYCMSMSAGNGRVHRDDCYFLPPVKKVQEQMITEQTTMEQTQESGTQTTVSIHSAKSPEMYKDPPKIWYLPLTIVAVATLIAVYILRKRRTRQAKMNESAEAILGTEEA
ncbi:hypothetical protein XENTR_v10004432 [Xenopus tropicalis]|uniref:Uncharacterized protein LOC101731925 n=1 Tax=Xenopus tropicalis TaxID=8364 RepID=A0A8J0R7Y5_XENTR|nr:uncharacterized protein LOC101731925 [Xenopus tropicalis]KAE8577098.1 hypothetical protein XENTR_v10004432 [Xenopus tropicalis]|eukprot:XP_004918480.1 PREDICTED: uncharacterized protein LOC101731925 [Xenopus tropicalis]